jgi:hypothetical protein
MDPIIDTAQVYENLPVVRRLAEIGLSARLQVGELMKAQGLSYDVEADVDLKYLNATFDVLNEGYDDFPFDEDYESNPDSEDDVLKHPTRQISSLRVVAPPCEGYHCDEEDKVDSEGSGDGTIKIGDWVEVEGLVSAGAKYNGVVGEVMRAEASSERVGVSFDREAPVAIRRTNLRVVGSNIT